MNSEYCDSKEPECTNLSPSNSIPNMSQPNENDTIDSTSEDDNFFLSDYQNLELKNSTKNYDIKPESMSADNSDLDIESINGIKSEYNDISKDDSSTDLFSQSKLSLSAGQYICHLCNFKCEIKTEFNKHLLTHYPYSCHVCDYASRTEGRLKRHIKDFHSTDSPENFSGQKVPTNNPKSLKCKHCGLLSLTKEKHWNHQRTHLDITKCLECPQCPFITEYKHHLEYHMRNHQRVKPYKCPKCKYCCVNKSMLNSHKKSHSNVYQFRCSDCNYASKYCHSLKQHIQRQKHRPARVLNEDGSLPAYDNSDEILSMKRGPNNRSTTNRTGNTIPNHKSSVQQPKPTPTNNSSNNVNLNNMNINMNSSSNNNSTNINNILPQFRNDFNFLQQVFKMYSYNSKFQQNFHQNLPNNFNMPPLNNSIPNPATFLSFLSSMNQQNPLIKLAQNPPPFNFNSNIIPNNYSKDKNNNNNSSGSALDLSLKAQIPATNSIIKHKCPICSLEIVEYSKYEQHLIEHTTSSSSDPRNSNNTFTQFHNLFYHDNNSTATATTTVHVNNNNNNNS